MKTVAKFRLDTLAALARQMTFTPQDTRRLQLSAAEQLLHEIDPAKAYPLDFVIFRITGYHPRRNVSSDLLTGLALQHDLGLLIEQLSETLELTARQATEPVLTIDDVTERFNVTSKTIQRWRRKGLPARRFVFNDGKRRVGFLLSSVERFVVGHREQVAGERTNLSQVDDAERCAILQHARRLAVAGGCWPDEIARRIARRFNRSPLTILHTVRRHDQEQPTDGIFNRAAGPIPDALRTKILRRYRRGMTIAELARKVRRPRYCVYRVILDERIARLTKRKARFIDDPLYHEPDAEDALRAMASQEQLTAAESREDLRVPRDLPPYLQELYRTPLLTPARERALFLLMNFHRFCFVQARRQFEPLFATARQLTDLEGPLSRGGAVKNDIVGANLRLVVSVAKKHLRPGLNLMELVSDGNITLMRAVDSFDVHRGNRFSTYATFALMKGFARSVPLMQSTRRGAVHSDEMLADIADANPSRESDRLVLRDELRQLLSRLSDRERRVLLAHYGLGEHETTRERRMSASGNSSPETYEELGARLGLSKQRVRQIEQAALAKLRAAVR
jgi:RNA polymerase primary sigma factor